ncbi:auxilin-like protein [Tanacetum coccineum]
MIYSGSATKLLFALLHSLSIQIESSLHYVNKFPLGGENLLVHLRFDYFVIDVAVWNGERVLSQKGSGVGRGVKEKSKVVAAKDGISPSVIVETVVKEKQSSLVDTSIPNVEKSGLGSYPPLPTHGSTPAGNTPGMSLYANVTSAPSRKALNFCTLFTQGGNGVDVVVPVESIRAISERFANTAYGFFLGKRVAYSVVANYVRHTWGKYCRVKSMLNSSTRSSYVRAIIELQADIELNDTIVVAMHKLTREEYEWKPPRCACCKVFGHIQEDCPKNPGLGVAKNLKKPNQTPRGVPVGLKVGFKPSKEYRHVSKKPTANTSGNKKNDVESTKKGLQIWKVTLVDDEGELVKNVDYPGDYDSEDEVASADNDMARSMASEKVGFGTNSLLEQWRDTYENGD